MEDQKEFKYLALGDSYTIGESVDPAKTFPELLANELRSQGVNVKRPQIVATTGWTTMDLYEGILAAPAGEFEYDMVSLLIGVNDQYQGKPFDTYEENFGKLLETAIRLAGGEKDRVFIVSIPDYAYTPFGQKKDVSRITREINAYNETNRRIAGENQVLYFDITEISRKGLSDPSLVATDELHPSGKMYQEWVDLMAETICDRFKR
ncbi:MAG: SGNH/GDSL hydrolase family protein [Saprospiraceae bacterium]|nr:SGNH/GDSL hydrolase family protein [Saprospiraceae bacterium]